jgi:YfiH family protein
MHDALSSYMTLPRVPDPFVWFDAPWGPVLRCQPLEPFAHCFTTRHLGLTSPQDWRAVGALVGAAAVVSLHQVHGRDVVRLGRGAPIPDEPPRADALVTDRPDVAVAVRAADCVPLLMADERTGAVAAVHAGWRGTAAGVATAALQALRDEYGTRPADVRAAFGPSIGACCYEVGSELVDAFAAAGHPRDLVDRWFHALPPPRGSRARPSLRLDVAGANRDQLILAGVPEDRIHLSQLCTAMHLDVLTSYRAERAAAGRIAGVIRPLGARA